MTKDDIKEAKIALKIPDGPLSPEETDDAMDKIMAWVEAKEAAAQKAPTPVSQSTTGCPLTPSGASANPAPRSNDTNAPKAPIAPEDLAAKLSEYFGQGELVFVKPDDPRIPEPLQVTAERATALNWKLPDVVAGVVCDRSPQPLQAIVLPGAEHLAAFRTTNPALASTLVTWWPHVPSPSTTVLWVRCSNIIARNVTCGSVTWVAAGIVPVGVPTMDAQHFLRSKGPIACVDFSEIKWPAQMEHALRILRLEELFGPKYRWANANKLTLNTTFWAHFVAKRTEVAFLSDEKTFCALASGKLAQVSDDDMLKIVMQTLREASAADYEFPIASLRPSMAKQILEEMKIAVAIHRPGKREGLAEFFDHRVVKRWRHSLTVEQLYGHYIEFCRTMGRPRFMPDVFMRVIPGLVEKKFGVLKSHDLIRLGSDGLPHARRGFHGLELKEQDQETLSSAPDAADGPDAPDGTSQTLKSEPQPQQSEKVAN